MNIFTKAFCFFFIVVSSNLIFSKNHFYYSPDGEQSLNLATDKIIIKFSNNLTFEEKKVLLKNEKSLNLFTKKMELPAPKISIVTLKDKISDSEIESLLARLEAKNEILYATPFLIYEDGTYQGIWEEFLVKLRSHSDFGKLEKLAKNNDVRILAENEFQPNLYTLLADKNSSGNALELANKFYETGIFEYSEPNFILLLKKFTNDTFYGNQWSLENTGTNTSTWNGVNDADMDVDLAWNMTTGSSSIKVAILDEGVDLVHPDLVGNLLPGYDATGQGSNGAPSNDDAHGTACAGIVAATANNSIGVAGVAYSCKIVPVRIAYDDGSGWVTSNTWIANATNWAWQTGNADILSNSWGGGSSSSAINSAINGAITSGRGGLGSPVLFSAGNDDSSVNYPAYLSDVISVAAMSMCNERKSPSSCDNESWWGSNYGTNLDIAAPGVKIYTTDISGVLGYNSGDYTATFNGTSSACPNAAGVMALILSADPTLTETQARFAIESTCDKVGGYSYNSGVSNQPNGTWSNELGYGSVNAMSAVQFVSIPTTVVMTSAIAVTPNPMVTGQSVSATVSVQNTDSQTWNGNFYLALHDVNGGFIADIDVLNNQTLVSGATQTLNFSKPNITSPGGQYSIYLKYETSSNGLFPLVPSNGFTNPLQINISAPCVTAYPYAQNFDTFSEPLAISADGWENVSGEDFDWSVISGPTPSSNTGPNGDNTSGSGSYLYTESSSPNYPSKISYLLSPCFDFTSISSPELKFWFHLYGLEMGSLDIDVLDLGTNTYTNSVFTLTGQQQTSSSDVWQEATVDLSAFAGENIRVRFRAITGSGYTSDICIDDVSVENSFVIPPTISVSPSSVNENLALGQTSSQNVMVSNIAAGSPDLTFTASLQNLTSTSPQKKKGNSVISQITQNLSKGDNSKSGTGNPQLNSFGGPDTFGYEWKDSNEISGPTYNWTDISGTGNLATWTAISSYDPKDEGIAQAPIGFNFDFYGNTYTSVYICTNGFVSFDSFTGDTWTNQSLPSSTIPDNLIAGFWDDLNGTAQGDVFYQTIGNEFIIQFDDWPNYGTTSGNTFQVILNSNGSIKIQYENILGSTSSCSVGIEDANGTDGLSVINNALYVANSMAIEFTTPANTNWISVSPISGAISANGSTNLTLDFNSNGIASGTYTADLQINSNDSSNPIVTIPISLVAGGNQPPTANAGSNQTITEGLQVTLDGSGSSDPENDPLNYTWTQTSGTTVTLSSNSVVNPTFTAPEINGSEILTFSLVVDDGSLSSSASTVGITVNDKAPTIYVSQNSISETLASGQTSSQIIGITNSNAGSSDLTYTASLQNYSVTSPISSKKNTSQISATKLPKGNNSAAGTGTPQTNSAGGPDTFGYEWKDSNEPNGPTYSWTDISGTGTLATNWTATSTYDGEDEGYAFVPIGFAFDFYGNSYSDVYIGSNGFLTFDIFTGDTYINQSLPSGGTPNNLIAGFWDDLDGSAQGDVFYETNGNEFIVQFDDWPEYATTNGATFQMILNSNGEIKFQYENITGTLTGAVVGIENSSGTDGLEVVQNAAYVTNNLAVEFYPPTQTSNWLTLSQNGGTVSALSTDNLTLNFDAANLINGNYSVDLVVNSDDTTNANITIPVTLVVGSTLGQMTPVSISKSNTNVVLSWNPTAGAISYKIYRSTSPNSGFTEIANVNTNSWTDTNVGANTKYFYKITANN
ncbi:MAG: hypothetical protein DWQ06_07825 [Calditrichaeota bacterium]|nr:MAG: hypothetical protein DWQ06_07825 [Calditrichota bacterium]